MHAATKIHDVQTLRHSLAGRYREIRNYSDQIAAVLSPEDCVVQSCEDVSPTKWHLAHTSWFFETFLLIPEKRDYLTPNPEYQFLFNSYYNTVGKMHERPKRGLISRPGMPETWDYRRFVDQQMLEWLDELSDDDLIRLEPVITLGLNHEQQHQELMVTDVKHVLSQNPLHPMYQQRDEPSPDKTPALQWVEYADGIHWVGSNGPEFTFDNEGPRHQQFVHAFQIASRPVSNAEYLEFIEDGGYHRADLWLSDGWATVNREGWEAPLYWERKDGVWRYFTLSGFRPVTPSEPVCHISYYEAMAYAAWAGYTLPTEAQWETAAAEQVRDGTFADSQSYHPAAMAGSDNKRFFGDVWEWTRSAYLPYHGYQPPQGALGEYNGKFMSGQMVLKGGSCATPEDHIRLTYRNFFRPHHRWQFMGIRLVKDL